MKRFSQTLRIVLALFLAIFSSGIVQVYTASTASALATDHIVVCHKTGSGYNLVPPSQTSEHLTDPDDFVIETTYSPTQVWDNYKDEYQMLCDAGPTATTPTAPTFTDLCGTDNDTYTIPTKTGIAYYVNGSATAANAGVYPGSGTVTIVAKALWGQVLTGTTQWSYTFLATPACTISVTPQTPSTTPVCGANNDLFIIPTQTGVTYSGAVWANNSATVTATAQSGYTLTGTTSWTFTDANDTCPMPVTPVAPTVTPITACVTYGSIVMATTPGVTYTLTVGDGKQGAYTVTATAQTNYYFTEGSQTSWSGDLGTYFDCLVPVTPAAPIQNDTCYHDNDWYYIPSTAHVTYSVDGSAVSAGWHAVNGSTVTVTAAADTGYYLAEGTPNSWTLTYTDQQCVTISKSADKYIDTNGNGVVDSGDSVNWTITLTNVSSEALDDSILDDHFLISIIDEGATLDETTISDLAPGASVTLHASKPLSASEVQACKAANTASFFAWRQISGTEQVISVNDETMPDPVATGSASATLAMNCGQVLGTSTTVNSPAPQVLPATIANTGATPHQLPLLVGLVLSAATYYFVLRRQDQRA